MLHKVKTLAGFNLRSLDGEIGKVEQFYFDDHHWTIRYLIADTGNWLTGRQVLISPYALTTVNKAERYIAVDLTQQQIADSPSLDTDKPVSRQFEESYLGYYGWPTYWNGTSVWGNYPYIERSRGKSVEINPGGKPWNHHLRSTAAVNGYTIEATDGAIGHVDDFVVDDEAWRVRYLVIDTRNWWPGKKVLLSPEWIERVSWDMSTVYVNLSRDEVKQAPEYTEESLLSRDYENGLYQHYKRQGYWINEESFKAHSR